MNDSLLEQKRELQLSESSLLTENAEAALEAIKHARPAVFKGRFVLNAAVAATMSPSLTLDDTMFAKF